MTDDPPSIVAVRNQIIEELLRFVRRLRAADVTVPADGGLTAAKALGTVGISDESRARTAVHAALVADTGARTEFDRLFDDFWYRVQAILDAAVRHRTGVDEDVPDDVFAPLGGDAGGHRNRDTNPMTDSATGDHSTPDGEASTTVRPRDRRVTAAPPTDAELDESGTTARYSPTGTSEPVDLAENTLLGDNQVVAHVDALGAAVASIRARHWQSNGHRRPDIRTALRSSVTTGGVPVPIPEQDRARTAMRATMVVDVSQSVLDTIDRGFLIRFLRTVTTRWRDVRVFFFDTELRDVTDAFDTRSVAAAIDALDDAEAAWGGGTRIGHAFDTLREQHPDAVDRRTAVFVISDGLEVGDIDRLADGAAWLGARAAHLFWLNPLAADPAYEPTVRGMAAAHPHVDGLFAFTQPRDVATIARHLRVRGPGGSIGYEFESRVTDEPIP